MTLTNEAIGEMIGLTHSAVSRLLTGERTPGIPTIKRIAKAFGRPTEEVFNAAAGSPTAGSTEQRRQSWGTYFRNLVDGYEPAAETEAVTVAAGAPATE